LQKGNGKGSRESADILAKKENLSKVKDLLIELKDTSELMIDLAYSALLFSSEEIAEEVRMLEERVDDLETEYLLRVLSLIGGKEDRSKYLGLLRLGEATERMADAAAAMTDVILSGMKPHSVYRLVIEEADETTLLVRVSENSILSGETLGSMRLEDRTGMRVIAIRRNRFWVFAPDKETGVENGDILIARGVPEGEQVLRGLASGEIRTF
jgi:uncharacterized protein with PhoU and TrkA domain